MDRAVKGWFNDHVNVVFFLKMIRKLITCIFNFMNTLSRQQRKHILQFIPRCSRSFLNEEQRRRPSLFLPELLFNLPLISQSRWLTVEEIPLRLKQVRVCCVCPSSKCQRSADWMHVDRDNCGAACCQGRGRAAQWPRLVTHLRHCWPTGWNRTTSDLGPTLSFVTHS